MLNTVKDDIEAVRRIVSIKEEDQEKLHEG